MIEKVMAMKVGKEAAFGHWARLGFGIGCWCGLLAELGAGRQVVWMARTPPKAAAVPVVEGTDPQKAVADGQGAAEDQREVISFERHVGL
jgi:hypothetical protein